MHHCKKHHGREVPWSDRMEFVNGWYILIIVSDLLTIIGSILKMEIQTKVMATSCYCSMTMVKVYKLFKYTFFW